MPKIISCLMLSMANLRQAYSSPQESIGRYDIAFNRETGDSLCATNHIPKIMIIDSSKRESPRTTSANNYTYRFPATIRDVVSIELVFADVPNGNYNVTSNNNIIHLTLNELAVPATNAAPEHALVITPGLYNEAELLTIIEDEIVELYGNQPTFNIAKNDLTGLLTFTSDWHFTFYFDGGLINEGNDDQYHNYSTRSLARLLGFQPFNITSNNKTITASYPIDIEMEGVVALYIDGLERCDSNNNYMRNAFCLLPLETVSANYGLLKDADTIQNDDKIYYFPAPTKVDKLNIKFKDWDGNYYDFNGYEHLLIFKIHTLSSAKKYCNIERLRKKTNKKKHHH